MPPSQAGVAAAVASTSRQIGQTLGVAVLGALAGGGVGAIGPSFARRTTCSWWIVVGLGVVILGLAILTTTRWALQTARRTAERFREPGRPAAAADRPRPPLSRRPGWPRAEPARTRRGPVGASAHAGSV